MPCAQPDHCLRLEPGNGDQLVERIILRFAVDYLRQRGFNNLLAREQRLGRCAAAQSKVEVVDMGELTKRGRHLFDYIKTEIFEHRHNVGKRHRSAGVVHFQAECAVILVLVTDQTRHTRVIALHREQPDHVLRGLFDRICHAVRLRENGGVAFHQSSSAFFIGDARQFGLDRRLPPAHHQLQAAIKRSLVKHHRAIFKVEKVTKQANAPIFKPDGPAEHGGTARFGQHRFNGAAQTGGNIIARQPDKDEHVPPERGTHREQFGPRPIDQRHRGQRHALEVRRFERYQQIVRQRGQCMRHGLASMPRWIEAVACQQVGKLGTQERDALWRGRERSAGPKATRYRKSGQLAAFANRHHQYVQLNRTVHRRNTARFEDQRRFTAVGKKAGGAYDAFTRQQGDIARSGEPQPFHTLAATHDALVCQNRHRAVDEPAHQRRALTVGQAVGIGRHRALHLSPIGHGAANILQHRIQIGGKRATFLRIDPRSLDIDEAFAIARQAALLAQGGEVAGLVAFDIDNRVDQAFDSDIRGSQGRGDRIHEERHVVIDQGNAHRKAARCICESIDGDIGLAAAAFSGSREHEIHRLCERRLVQSVNLAGKRRCQYRCSQGFCQFGIGTRHVVHSASFGGSHAPLIFFALCRCWNGQTTR